MNPATAQLVLELISLAENAYAQVKGIMDREKSGNPLNDTELDALKSQSDAAHVAIQDWKPGQ